MNKFILRSFSVVLVLIVSSAAFAMGNASGGQRAVAPVILSVAPDVKQRTLVISGERFGATTPIVRLANRILEVKSASASRIVAGLPADVRPATYRLTVTVMNGRREVSSDAFHAAL